jgi:hypothetical protein
MPSAFDTAAALAIPAFFTVFGAEISYAQGETIIEALDAVSSTTTFEQPNTDGLYVKTEMRRYEILVENLEGLTPAAGDTITEEINGETQTFIVAPPPGGKAVYDYADEQQTLIRISAIRRAPGS